MGKLCFTPSKFEVIFNSTSNISIFAVHLSNFQIFVIQPILFQNSHITFNYLFIFFIKIIHPPSCSPRKRTNLFFISCIFSPLFFPLWIRFVPSRGKEYANREKRSKHRVKACRLVTLNFFNALHEWCPWVTKNLIWSVLLPIHEVD